MICDALLTACAFGQVFDCASKRQLVLWTFLNALVGDVCTSLAWQTVRSAGVVQLSLVIGSPREPTVQHDHVCVGA